METFRFVVKETNTGYVDITANSKDEAEEMVLDAYNEGNVTWTDSTIADIAIAEGGQRHGTY